MGKIVDSMSAAARDAGGARATRSDRESHYRDFAAWAHQEANIQIRDVSRIKEKHIRAYFQARSEQGLSKGTLQNRAASLRAALRGTGSEYGRIAADKLTNSELGIDGRSRIGTKTAMSPERYEQAREALLSRGYEREAAGLALAASLGLRAEEVVQSHRSLATWERRLEEGRDQVRVIHGTKGGRPRDVRVHDRERTLAAVREARSLAGRGYLIRSASPTLASAMDRWHNTMHRVAGLRGKEAPHALRYAYTRTGVDRYQGEGYTQGESRALASGDLGHGDGRGRWVSSTYLR
ncbi:integrase domain-containing protein [Thioalkalivibrio thiocyanoxidans]|uniref:integrase domain-containing protein n=1 Tax=Thioalkalivibrio thiocyanoxidans TaxID=152475 RepID=UPI0003711D26|nr:integrase domain-containing protein [Thioalkalivibrio thiocyanoxidans]